MAGFVTELRAKGYERITAKAAGEVVELLIGLPEYEVRRLADDEHGSILQRTLASGLLNKGTQLRVLMELLDRAHGKPKQAIDHTSADGSITPPKIVLTRVILPTVPQEQLGEVG